MALNTRTRGRVGALTAAALALGGIVAAAPASAAPATESTDALHWGFKQSFRTYVAGGMNTEPVGERIVPQAPAQFDGDGDAETRPYAFPVSKVSVTDTDNLAISSAGGVTYNFPAHTFTVSISDVSVIVEDGDGRVEADLDIVVTAPFGEFEAGEYHEQDVHVADVADLDVTHAEGIVTVAGSGLTLTADGAAYLPYNAGDALDDFTVTVPDASETWVPQIAVSRVAGLASGDSITVKGWGFDPAANVGTRAPVQGQLSGIYVVFGKFADDWRPSDGAPFGARTVIDQHWPIPEPSFTAVKHMSSQFELLGADGSFATTLTADGAEGSGNYGVYTYAAGGPSNAAHEFAVPVSFATPVLTTEPQATTVTVGDTATFSVAANGADALQWQSRTGSGDWADVAGATAASLEVATTAVAQSGTQYRVVASNAGGTVESAAATLTVTKAEAAVSVKVKKKFRFAVKRKATVTVDAPEGVAAAGAVVIKAGKKTVGKGTVKNGTAKVTLNKKLRPGARKLVAEFAGSADLTAAASAPVKVQIRKAKAKTTAKIAKAKKVKAGKRAVLRVRVTGKNVKPKGKVRIVVRQGKNKVRTITARVKGGKVTKVRLPRLDKGKYQVRVKYQGNKKIAKKSAKRVVLRVR